MDAAAYGVIGACFGVALTSVVTLATNRTSARLKMQEMEFETRRAQQQLAVASRNEKAQRYAAFLSAFWQEERFASEMLENVVARRAGWSEAIRRINSSPAQHQAPATLNEALGWLSVLCHDPAVEQTALGLSLEFDRAMELFGTQLNAVRTNAPCDLELVGESLRRVRALAIDLSTILRRDLEAPRPFVHGVASRATSIRWPVIQCTQLIATVVDAANRTDSTGKFSSRPTLA